MGIRLKDLSKLGYTNNVTRSMAVTIINKYCKHDSKEVVWNRLADLLENPGKYTNDPVWCKLAANFLPAVPFGKTFITYEVNNKPLPFKTYGGKFIESIAKQQMELAMRLPVTVAGVLMPDTHVGYGLPIGDVLATENVVILYAVGVDIGCRMSLRHLMPESTS